MLGGSRWMFSAANDGNAWKLAIDGRDDVTHDRPVGREHTRNADERCAGIDAIDDGVCLEPVDEHVVVIPGPNHCDAFADGVDDFDVEVCSRQAPRKTCNRKGWRQVEREGKPTNGTGGANQRNERHVIKEPSAKLLRDVWLPSPSRPLKH
jgi:hypothetical protein